MIQISACVIVKNEAANLPAWLKCMQQVADEIIVVDTGSTDDTATIAKAGGAKVYEFSWINDFAAAKNYAISKAHGKWIIFMDADEVFTPATIANVRPLLQKFSALPKVAGFCCRLINIEKEAPHRVRDHVVQIRIFKNGKGIKYVGKLHEALDIPKDYKIELTKKIEINHTGYSSEIIAEKLQRNLNMLQENIAANGGKITTLQHRYFMDCYYGLKQYEKAIEHGRQAIASNANSVSIGNNLHVYMILISLYQLAKRDKADIETLLAEAIACLPDKAALYLIKGLLAFRYGKYIVAEASLQKGLQLNEKKELTLESLENDSEKFMVSAYIRLGEINAKKLDYQQAEQYIIKALQVNPLNISALDLIIKYCRKQNKDNAAILALLNELYQSKEERISLLCELRELQEYQLALYYANKYGEISRLSPVQRFMAAERYDGVLSKAGEQLVGLNDFVDIFAGKEFSNGRERFKQMKQEVFALLKDMEDEHGETQSENKKVAAIAEE